MESHGCSYNVDRNYRNKVSNKKLQLSLNYTIRLQIFFSPTQYTVKYKCAYLSLR